MKKSTVYTVIGLMSGTSLDGVDAALIRTDGRDFVEPVSFLTISYTPNDRGKIRKCYGMKDAKDLSLTGPAELLTLRHAEAVKALLQYTGYEPQDIDLVGFHGQTIYHAPKDGVTIQIGDGDLLARETGINVIDDFRSNDVKTGGEGAPLAPLYHAARIKSAKIDLPAVILNIGGVANVTWIGADETQIMAFDTGPGNALMDDWAKEKTGKPYDVDGTLAAAGKPSEALLKTWFDHPYFKRKPPKSMDRDQWDIAGLGQLTQELNDLSAEDGAATLMHFTVESIVRSVAFMSERPKRWYACGGGRHNKALMNYLGQRLAGEGYGVLEDVEALGWNGDATEAECFGYLAVRSFRGLNLSVPGTTGVEEPVTGGRFHSAR